MTAYAFAGEWQDATNLLHLRARYLSMQTGRFLTADSWEDYQNPLTLNKWNYVQANPINWTDPSGYYRWNGASKFQHQDIEDYLEQGFGRWKLHLEYKIGRGKSGTLRVDVLYFEKAVSAQSAFYPPKGTWGEVYEIEPYYGPQSVIKARVEADDKYRTALDMVRGTELLMGDTPDGNTYDWRKVAWDVGDTPIPSQPKVIRRSRGGYYLIWYAGEGAIMYVESTWDDIQLPPRMIDWLEMHQDDSEEVQQFYEMIVEAKNKGILVDNWPVDSKYPAYLAWLAACAAAVRAASAYLERVPS